MTVRELVQALGLEVLTPPSGLDQEITGGYVSDLLSDVIAHAKAGHVWITLQTHRNIIAVATLKELAAIALVAGRTPDSETLAKAREEDVPVLASRLPAFELAGRLYQLGVRGDL
jgi:predicted transcriptional regulator